MFTNDQRQGERTGKYGTPRLQYLQELVSQFQNTTDEETKEKIAANLANFAYDPYNYSFLRQLNVLELYLDCLTEPNEKLVEFGIGGICNSCVDPANAAILTQCDGIPLVIQCLSSPVRNTVNYALGALYYLCNKSNREEILKPEVVDVIERYAAAQTVNVSFSNLAKAFLDKHVSKDNYQRPNISNLYAGHSGRTYRRHILVQLFIRKDAYSIQFSQNVCKYLQDQAKLAGVVLGPSVSCRIHDIREFFIQPTSGDYYQFSSYLFEIMFMFLIGLETDISFSKRNLYVASITAYSGLILNSILGAALSPLFIKLLRIPDKKIQFATVIMMILANSASLVVIRLVADLKLDTSDVGRLAVTSSLVNEMSCVLVASLYHAVGSWKSFSFLFLTFLVTGLLIGLNQYLAFWINKSDGDNKYVNNADVSFIFFLILMLSFIVETCGYSSTISCFLVGLMFPRKGKTCRTLLSKLSYLVDNFLLPIYFGYIGFQFDVNYLNSIGTIITVVVMILLNFGGKLVSTFAACHYLKVPLNEGFMFALILSLKGHFDLQLINVEPNSRLWWNPCVHSVLLSTVVFDTVIGGIIVAFTVKREEKSLSHKQTSLELHDPESELRILACTYGSRHSSGSLGLISALGGSKRAIVTPYLMHLVERPEKRKTNLMYHQLAEGDQYSDEDDYGGDDAVDTFTSETKILINIVKAVSSFASLYEDVCTGAEDRCVSIIFLPFHEHQRIDGNMEIDKEGIRATNQRVLPMLRAR
ncbi:hypothetical protein QUC31_018714 [Theobroma cacao]